MEILDMIYEGKSDADIRAAFETELKNAHQKIVADRESAYDNLFEALEDFYESYGIEVDHNMEAGIEMALQKMKNALEHATKPCGKEKTSDDIIREFLSRLG